MTAAGRPTRSRAPAALLDADATERPAQRGHDEHDTEGLDDEQQRARRHPTRRATRSRSDNHGTANPPSKTMLSSPALNTKCAHSTAWIAGQRLSEARGKLELALEAQGRLGDQRKQTEHVAP